MSLFQNAILKKYLKETDEQVSVEYAKFTAYFHNPEIQQNIRDSKEEQFQEGFLRELFVKVLGYTLNPDPNFNLITEKKNETDAKKADAAILLDGEVIGVIELKDGKTTDLKTVETQAFGYKLNNRNAVYVIISNFEKLRFYIDNAVDFIEFNLFTLSKEDFAVLWLCLHYDHISKHLPKQIKNESVNTEDQITKELYKDYAAFKKALFDDLTKNNSDYDRLLLFKKSQKLIDRFLFILFAEDSGLLPPNSVLEIINQWISLKEEYDEHFPLYGRFKKYFGYLNTGHKGKKHEIFAYNGGLFLEDDVLDNIKISDEVLQTHLTKICGYDFSSDVDVNILGHIFENSLTEIEEITNSITSNTEQATVGKRKKDGVFYTPRYITSYIVENTLGKLCKEKKQEMGIVEADYFSDKKRTKAIKQKLDDKIVEYRNWLLTLTICDPACGSGAFLNAALDFLITEHKLIDEMRAKINDGVYQLFDNIENSILENNLFGVDINEESVEIAKLSLWLRTAKPHRKLNSLNENIKCGNSLISDPSVAGEKAFDWVKEFPKIFNREPHEKKKNLTSNYTNERELGFDVVIGNPPYGIIIDENHQKYYSKNYPLTRYKTNLYVLFIERTMQIFQNSLVHFIIPKSLLFNTYHESIRKELLLKTEINEIFSITEKVFEDAEVGGSLLINFKVKKNENKKETKLVSAEKIEDFVTHTNLIEKKILQNYFLETPNCEISITNQQTQSIIDGLYKLNKLSDFYNIKNGLNPGNIKHILISTKKATDKHKPIIWGKELTRYNISWTGSYINYDKNIEETISINDVKSKNGMNKQEKIDFALRTPDLFEVCKIVVRKTGDSLIASYDDKQYYFDTLIHGIYEKDKTYKLKSLLAILNSKPATFFYRLLHDIKGKVFAKISLENLASFPVPKTLPDELGDLADQMLTLNAELQKSRQTFLDRLNDNFNGIKITGAIENFYEVDFKQFLAELKKQKIELSLKQQDEWAEYFNDKKGACERTAQHISETDKAIDKMVYELYGLTEEEIAVVENS